MIVHDGERLVSLEIHLAIGILVYTDVSPAGKTAGRTSVPSNMNYQANMIGGGQQFLR